MEEKFVSLFYKSKEELEKDSIKAKEILEKAGARQEDVEGMFKNIFAGCNDEVIWTIVNSPDRVSEWAERVGFENENKFWEFRISCMD